MAYALRILAALLLAVALKAEAPPAAGVGPVPEEQARAAFLFQLAQYVTWPPESFSAESAPVRVCVLGQDTLYGVLEAMVQRKKIQERPVSIRKVDTPSQMMGCHIAFIGLKREKQLRELFAGWTYPPVLLMGEAERFAEIGGIVNLIIQGGRVSFEINTDAAARARIDFRSQLLRFARIITNEPAKRR